MCVDNTPIYLKILRLIIPLLIISGFYLIGSLKYKNYKKFLIPFIIISGIIFVVWFQFTFMQKGC